MNNIEASKDSPTMVITTNSNHSPLSSSSSSEHQSAKEDSEERGVIKKASPSGNNTRSSPLSSPSTNTTAVTTSPQSPVEKNTSTNQTTTNGTIAPVSPSSSTTPTSEVVHVEVKLTMDDKTTTINATAEASPKRVSNDDVSAVTTTSPPIASQPTQLEQIAVVEQVSNNFGVDEKNHPDKLDYYRNIVTAVDRLYPSTKWPLHATWTFGLVLATAVAYYI
jgi:hypothetical protein